MKHSLLLGAVTGLLVTILAITSARGETFVGSNIDSRVLVGIKASDEGVQGFLPEGWGVTPFLAGPLKSANLLLVMIDSLLELDPDGKPLDPPSRRAVALVALGKQADGDAVRMYVLRVFSTAPARDPYSNAQRAGIAREHMVTGPADGERESKDFWRVAPKASGRIALTLNYTSGNRSWSAGESFPYSATTPEFSRIYRYDQMVDVVMSQQLGKEMTGEFKLHVSVLELADIFDGTEEVIAIMDVPVYVRKVYLP